MAILAGLIAAAAALFVSATVCIFLVEMVTGSGPYGFGSAPIPTGYGWIVYAIVGFTLSLAVTAYRGTHQFVTNRRTQGEQPGKTATAKNEPKVRRSFGWTWTILLIVGALALFGAKELYRRWQLHQTLLAVQIELRKQLPKIANSYTTMVDVRVGFTSWTYVYSVTIARNELDIPTLKAGIRRSVCANDFMKTMISNGVSYNYEYRDMSDAFISSFEIDSCP